LGRLIIAFVREYTEGALTLRKKGGAPKNFCKTRKYPVN